MEPYRLELAGGVITGFTAVVGKLYARREAFPFVLDIVWSLPGRKEIARIPSCVALARWLAARQEWDQPDLGLLHLSFRKGQVQLEENINEPLARRYLEAIMKTAAVADHPRAGSWCRGCTAPCLEVTRL